MTTTITTATAPSDADKAAVAAVPERIVAAWSNYDADAFAAVFTEDGTMILPGIYQKGRPGIRAFMVAAFAGPYQGTQVTGQPIDVRFLNSETGVVITQGGVLAPGQTEVPPDQAIHASWIVVKQDGTWLLAAYHNSPVTAAA